MPEQLNPAPLGQADLLELIAELERHQKRRGFLFRNARATPEELASVRKALQAIKAILLWLQSANSDATTHFVSNLLLSQPPQPCRLRHWGFLAYLLSRKARQEVFEPALQELYEDYVIACGQYPDNWQRRGINGIFAWRAVCLGWQCIRAVVGDRVIQFLERLAPQLVRWWLTR
jgi:hypothetical protein